MIHYTSRVKIVKIYFITSMAFLKVETITTLDYLDSLPRKNMKKVTKDGLRS